MNCVIHQALRLTLACAAAGAFFAGLAEPAHAATTLGIDLGLARPEESADDTDGGGGFGLRFPTG